MIIMKEPVINERSNYNNKEGKSMEFEKLQQIIADVLSVDVDEITRETTFQEDLGADSLDVFQIIMGVEEEFNIEIPTSEAEKIVTVGDAADAIKNAVR
jgi:acyl carrier protein